MAFTSLSVENIRKNIQLEQQIFIINQDKKKIEMKSGEKKSNYCIVSIHEKKNNLVDYICSNDIIFTFTIASDIKCTVHGFQ